jgi:hypothetical protein
LDAVFDEVFDEVLGADFDVDVGLKDAAVLAGVPEVEYLIVSWEGKKGEQDGTRGSPRS